MAPASKAQQKATAKYKKSNYDRLEISVPKGHKQAIQDVASAQGESLNAFVGTAIDERIARLETAPGETQDEQDIPATVGPWATPTEADDK